MRHHAPDVGCDVGTVVVEYAVSKDVAVYLLVQMKIRERILEERYRDLMLKQQCRHGDEMQMVSAIMCTSK